MRLRLLVPFLLLLPAIVSAQEVQQRYSEVVITVPERAQLDLVRELGEIDHAHVARASVGFEVRAVIGEREIAALRAAGFTVAIYIDDLVDMVEERAASCPQPPDYAPTGFFYGTMGCYPTLAQAEADLAQMHLLYPDLISQKISIGTSHEGRPIWLLRISAATDPEAVPEVLYTSLHHAREPQSLATVLWFMHYLLENYGLDPEVTALLDNRALYFVPILNPDGYRHNEVIAPSGGGMWRKNRRNNGTTFGVDLNRNYAYMWGGSGSSGSPGSDIYRGPAPFSEPETQALRLWLQSRSIGAAYNYHSWSNVWLYPWGYAPNAYTPDDALFAELSAEITRYNQYPYGTAANVLYAAAGDSDDWMYGEQLEKAKIFAFTPEVGSSADGFWPSPTRIAPLAHENVHANLVLAWFVGAYPRQIISQEVMEAVEGNGHLDPSEEGILFVTLENFGIGSLSGVRARLVSLNGDDAIAAAPWSEPFDFPALQTTVLPPVFFTLSADAPVGVQSGFALELEMDSGTATLPLEAITIGTPVLLLDESFDSFGSWTLNQWGVTTQAYSPPFALTDSPSGNYPDNVTNTLRLRNPIDLTTAEEAILRFRTRWDIQPDRDFLQVRVSTNNSTWTPLAGHYTRSGSGMGVQPAGQPGYDGTQTEWVLEEIDLSAFAGEPQLYLQFRMRSDESITAAGFVLDDVQIVAGYTDGATVSTEPSELAASFQLEAPYPNPVRDRTHLRFNLDRPAHVTLTIYDVLGRQVARLIDEGREAGAHMATWDGYNGGSPSASGFYVVELNVDGARDTRRLTVVR